MSFKNLSVAKKIWVLLLSVMGAILLAGVSMTLYLSKVEQKTRETMATYEHRVLDVTQWLGAVELYANNALAASSASSMDAIAMFERKNTEVEARVDRLAKQVDANTHNLAVRSALEKVAPARAKMQEAVDAVLQERRSDGDVDSLVQSMLLPAVMAYTETLNQVRQVQEQVRIETMAAVDKERAVATTVGGVAFALVVVLAIIVSVWLVRQLTQPLLRAVELADSIAAGDLTHDVHDPRQDELGQLLRSLGAMVRKLRSVVGEVHHGVESVSSAASQIASGSQDLSARTEQTAANLEETAASIEELTATVTQSADTARQANQLAATAVQAAEHGGEVVSQVVMSMEQINTSSRKISDIIGVIDGIAFQTNILALNAAVEAARAGEQGRGFAVVAGEVRSLAGRSAEAAKEIKALITDSVHNVDVGTEQVAQAGESMQEIVSSVRRVTDLIGEITASSSEQRDGISQVNQAVSNLDQMTQQNAALVEESSAAASSMNEQAQRLAEVVSVFNVGRNMVGGRTAATSPAASPITARTSGKALDGTAHKAVPTVAAAKPAGVGKPAAAKAAQSAGTAPKLLRPAPAKAAVQSDDEWETF